MATFPTLSTGAVTQYPVSLSASVSTEVIRFLDGSDQRCLVRGRPLQSWLIRLDLVTQEELVQIEEFFDSQQGAFASFNFPDPFSRALVSDCRFGSDSLSTQYTGDDAGGTSFWVVQTNG